MTIETNGVSEAIVESTLATVPKRRLLTIESTASIDDVIGAMNDSRTGYALVVEGNELVGIVTERDLLTKVLGGAKVVPTASVTEIMTRDPEVLPDHASIAFALQRMSEEGYRHIPLIDDMRVPVGCVAVRDIVNWIVDQLPESVMNLPPDPGYPKTVDGG